MMSSLEAAVRAQGRKASKNVRRQQLIDATIQVLAHRGYASLTAADVAKAAGLSVGIINFHFESKEKLLAASLAFLADEYNRNWKAAMDTAGPSTAEQLKAILLADFDDAVFTPTKLAAWIGFWGETQGRPIYREHCAAYDIEHSDVLGRLCKEIIDDGKYGYEPVAITRGLEAMGEGLWLGVVTANAEIGANVSAAEARRTISVCLAALFPKHFGATARPEKAI
jgi:AcrR family transcriptional regulator